MNAVGAGNTESRWIERAAYDLALEAERSAAEANQGASDVDQTASERDEADAIRDQLVADTEQAGADLGLPGGSAGAIQENEEYKPRARGDPGQSPGHPRNPRRDRARPARVGGRPGCHRGRA